MSARLLIVFTTVAACTGASSLLVACATNDDTPVTEPDANVEVPSPSDALDGGAEASTDGAAPDAGAEPCPSDALCPSESFGPQKPAGSLDGRVRIVMIRGRSASDAWAVGARGTIFHFDGTAWKRSESGTDRTINAIWPRDTGEVALSSLTTSAYTRGIALDDGAAAGPSAGGWTERALPTFADAPEGWLTSAWAPPGAEWLWSTTMEQPVPLPMNGLWRVRVSPTTNSLEVAEAAPRAACIVQGCRRLASIHGATANDLWAVGPTGATVHITDAQGSSPKITPIDSQTWADLHGVWVASAGEVWAVGAKGTILRNSGASASWSRVSNVPTSEKLRGIWGTSPTDIWAVGDTSVVLHYDGTTWSEVQVAGLSEPRPDLYTVWTPAPGHVWAAGDGVVLSLGGKP